MACDNAVGLMEVKKLLFKAMHTGKSCGKNKKKYQINKNNINNAFYRFFALVCLFGDFKDKFVQISSATVQSAARAKNFDFGLWH